MAAVREARGSGWSVSGGQERAVSTRTFEPEQMGPGYTNVSFKVSFLPGIIGDT